MYIVVTRLLLSNQNRHRTLGTNKFNNNNVDRDGRGYRVVGGRIFLYPGGWIEFCVLNCTLNVAKCLYHRNRINVYRITLKSQSIR